MKEVAILLLVALLLNGCGSTSTATQTAAGGLWSADDARRSGHGVRVQLYHAIHGERRWRGAEHFELSIPYRNMGGCFPVNWRNA